MSGAGLLRECAAGGPGGAGGAIGPMSWANILGPLGAAEGTNNLQTISGITGGHAMSASITGAGILWWNKGGANSAPYSGPITVHNGDQYSWTVFNDGITTVTGTVSVYEGSTLLDSFTYLVKVG